MDPLTNWEVLERVAAALVAGIVIGLEREWNDKPAGIRTYALVCQGSALFMIVALLLTEQMKAEGIASDPSRIASTVVQGIGFLAGGVIFTQHKRVLGLTTAAAVWVTAAIGLMIGAGFFREAVIAVLASIFVLIPMRWIERHVIKPAANAGQNRGNGTEPEKPVLSDEASSQSGQ